MAISTANKNAMIAAAVLMDTAVADLATAYTTLLSAQTAALNEADSHDAEKIGQATGPGRFRSLIGGRFRNAGIITLIEGRPAAAEAVSSIETVVTNLLG